MRAFFEDGRLVFEPANEHDLAELAQWWAQLQELGGDGTPPAIASATAEKALVLFIPQR